jgi:hypothetical protein
LNANADGKAENRNCAVFFVFAAKCDNFDARPLATKKNCQHFHLAQNDLQID